MQQFVFWSVTMVWGVSYEGRTHTALIISQTERIPCHLKYISAHSLSNSLTDNWSLDFTLYVLWRPINFQWFMVHYGLFLRGCVLFLKQIPLTDGGEKKKKKRRDSWVELTMKSYNNIETLGPDSDLLVHLKIWGLNSVFIYGGTKIGPCTSWVSVSYCSWKISPLAHKPILTS